MNKFGRSRLDGLSTRAGSFKVDAADPLCAPKTFSKLATNMCGDNPYNKKGFPGFAQKANLLCWSLSKGAFSDFGRRARLFEFRS